MPLFIAGHPRQKTPHKEWMMAKLYFNYAAMNAGKSTMLLQASYNYQERGMRTLILRLPLMTGRVLARLPRASAFPRMP